MLLLTDSEAAVSEALEKFTDTPTTMSHSLDNIKSVLACLASDGTHLDVKPLDIFRFVFVIIFGILSAKSFYLQNLIQTKKIMLCFVNPRPTTVLNGTCVAECFKEIRIYIYHSSS